MLPARCALFIREPLLDWTTEFGGHRLGCYGEAMAAMARLAVQYFRPSMNHSQMTW